MNSWGSSGRYSNFYDYAELRVVAKPIVREPHFHHRGRDLGPWRQAPSRDLIISRFSLDTDDVMYGSFAGSSAIWRSCHWAISCVVKPYYQITLSQPSAMPDVIIPEGVSNRWLRLTWPQPRLKTQRSVRENKIGERGKSISNLH